MSVQLVALRAFTPEDYLVKGKQKHVPTRPVIEVESHKELFTHLAKYLEQIDEKERWNLFYTVAHCKHYATAKKLRVFTSLDILAFDIDGVEASRADEYTDIIATFLGISDAALTIVASGNGLHYLVQLAHPILEDELKSTQLFYKEIIRTLQHECAVKQLPGVFDMILDRGRILRLPGTENRKLNKDGTVKLKSCKILQIDFTPHEIDFKKLSGLPEVPENESLSANETKEFHGVTDSEGVLSGCEFLKWTQEKPLEVKEPQAYAALSILSRLEGGREIAKKSIASWTGSRSVSQWDADQKIDQALAASGPRLCTSIALHSDKCSGCPYNGKVKSPIAIRGPNFIATEKSGFHYVIFTEGAVRRVPNVHDLRRFFEREQPYKVVNRKTIFTWTGKQFDRYAEQKLAAYAEEKFNPKVKTAVIEEFMNTFARYSVVDTDWFSESTEGFVNFQNGVLDSRAKLTGLMKHQPDKGFRHTLPFEYNPGAAAPTWEKFLSDIFDGDQDRAHLIEEFIGYALSGDPMWMQRAMLMTGEGSNGKSTLIDVIKALAGPENFSAIKIDRFNDPMYVANMDGKLFNISGETPKKGFEETAGFKELLGGDTITAREIYGQPFEFTNRAKIIFACNEIPRAVDNTHAFYRRFFIVEFDRRFDVDAGTADTQIGETLALELPGIYNRVSRAYEAAKARRVFTNPEASQKAVRAMQEEMDVVGTWLREALTPTPGSRITNQELFDAFRGYMNQTGNDGVLKAYSSQRLGTRLKKVWPRAHHFREFKGRGFEGLAFTNRGPNQPNNPAF